VGVGSTLVEAVKTPVAVEANALGVGDPPPLVLALGAEYFGSLPYSRELADALEIAVPFPTDACDMSAATEGKKKQATRLLACMLIDVGLESFVQVVVTSRGRLDDWR